MGDLCSLGWSINIRHKVQQIIKFRPAPTHLTVPVVIVDIMSPVIISNKAIKAGKAGKYGSYKMKNRTRNYRRDIEMVSRG